MEVVRIAAFADGQEGGNPAGVVICDELPSADAMQAIATEVGYSETAFAAPSGAGWRVRYFAPVVEVDFCGHATIALGATLAERYGNGVFRLQLNRANITVDRPTFDFKPACEGTGRGAGVRRDALGPVSGIAFLP